MSSRDLVLLLKQLWKITIRIRGFSSFVWKKLFLKFKTILVVSFFSEAPVISIWEVFQKSVEWLLWNSTVSS